MVTLEETGCERRKTDEIEPCACGGKSIALSHIEVPGIEFWMVSCNECRSSPGTRKTRQRAVALWNRRQRTA